MNREAKKWEHVYPWKAYESYKGKMYSGEWPTIVEMMDISTDRFPHNKCFTSLIPEKEEWDYTQTRDTMVKLSNYMVKELGVKKGDRIAVTGKNSPQWAFAYFATLYAGAIIVPLDNGMHDDDMEKFLSFAGCTYLFCDRERINSVDKDGTILKGKFSLEKGDPDHKYILDMMEDENVPRYRANEFDTAAILFTSGTTGVPKGVMLSHRNIVSDTYMCTYYMPLKQTDVFYIILPIHHAYTMTAVFMETVSVGASAVFGKRLAVSLMFREMKEGEVTMLLAVPLLYNKLIQGIMKGIRKKGIIVYGVVRGLMKFSGFLKKNFGINIGRKLFHGILEQVSMGTNRICISGGGPLPPETYKLWNELGIDFVQGYGLTEAAPITHLNPPWEYKFDSVGMKFLQEEHKIVDPDADGNGVLYVKGPNVMQGYYHNPEATKEVITEDGWLNTGDIGHIDEKGYLYLTGRQRSIIVTEGGKNVFPEEIEDKFQLYNEIAMICIIGYFIDRKERIEGVRAIVYPDKDFVAEMEKAHPDKEEARKAVRARIDEIVEEVNRNLQNYKKITKVTLTDKPLPMTTTAKIKRFEVKKLFENVD